MSGLDELLEADPRPHRGTGPAPGRPARGTGRGWRVPRWLVATAGGSLLLGGATALVLYALGVGLWYPLVPAGFFALLVLRRTVAGLTPTGRGSASHPAGAGAAPADHTWSDGLVPVVYRWLSRLRWERAGLWRSGRALQPHLASLVDERLRQRYGCTRTSDPDRARGLLGDRLWTYLAEPDARTPPPRELAAMLTTVEEL